MKRQAFPKSIAKKQVVIVGAKFGELYLNSFLEVQPALELVGLVAKGSPRAKALAEAFGIKLYHCVEDLPDTVDIACVVVRAAVIGGEGNHLTEALLCRGIHVIQEHPVSIRELLRHQQLAKDHKVMYWVNSFYPYTPAGRCLIRSANVVNQLLQQLPIYGNITTSRQLLYSTIDMLLQTYPHTDELTIKPMLLQRDQSGFDIISLSISSQTLGQGHVLLRLQNYLDPNDPDMHNLTMHNIQLGWLSGYLSLIDSYGPVSWTKVLHADNHLANQHSLYETAEVSVGRYLHHASNTLLAKAPDTMQQSIERDGPCGVSFLLNAMANTLNDTNTIIPDYLSVRFQREVVSLWQEIIDLVGPPTERSIEPAIELDATLIKYQLQRKEPTNFDNSDSINNRSKAAQL